MTVRPLEFADVASAARLHAEAFPGFFLSALGPAFLREFYRGFVTDAAAVTVVALDGSGSIVGVVVGSTQPGGFFKRRVRKQLLGFIVASVLAVVRHPRSLPRLLKAVRYRGEVPVDVSGALLSSICVSPNAQSAGVGRQLMDAWTNALREHGLSRAYLTTDRVNNEAANRFYVGAGWVCEAEYTTREGREMNCYSWRAEQHCSQQNDDNGQEVS
ncbi:MAG TPA: N-acetyltransferase [Gemmatimonadaceae bacterium]|nr:N-acetyltransferase [Gemmatimonadaceae bacterium]